MPNWVSNEFVEIDEDDLQKFVLNDDEEIDFNKLIPETGNPDDEKYDWYSWRCDHWGCKWNADTLNPRLFNTPWSEPEVWLKELAKHCDFILECHEESWPEESIVIYKAKNGKLEQDFSEYFEWNDVEEDEEDENDKSDS